MTERENLRCMLAGERPDHLPLDVWMTEPSSDMLERHTGSRDEVATLGLAVERVWPRFPDRESEWRRAYADLGFDVRADAYVGSMGSVHDAPPSESLGAAYHLLEMRHPLSVIESVAQLDRLPWPDVDAAEAYTHLRPAIDGIHARGRAAVGAMDCTAFESAWYLRGMDRLYLDLMDGTGIADWLLDWFTHRAIAAVRRYVDAGVDIVWLGDDVGTQRGMMMAVPFWQEHLKPRLRRVTEAVRNAAGDEVPIAYHSDGDVRPIIDDLVEIGIDVLNPVQPECMPLTETIARHHHHLAFWGMIGTQTTMPYGTAADVGAAVGALRELAESGVRIVVSPTHAIEPDVPWDNLAALVEEARRPLHMELVK